MFDNLISFLKSKDINYSIVEEKKIITFPMRTEKGHFQCFGDVDEDFYTFIFYTIIGVTIPKDKRLVACELLTRINYGIVIGNFEMDMFDGEIRYKTSIDYEGSELTDKFIDNLISANSSMVDNYFYPILECISSISSAEEILDKYESSAIEYRK